MGYVIKETKWWVCHCGYEWLPRSNSSEVMPKVCPKCNSKQWDKDLKDIKKVGRPKRDKMPSASSPEPVMPVQVPFAEALVQETGSDPEPVVQASEPESKASD